MPFGGLEGRKGMGWPLGTLRLDMNVTIHMGKRSPMVSSQGLKFLRGPERVL